jgi:hypothetical protein
MAQSGHQATLRDFRFCRSRRLLLSSVYVGDPTSDVFDPHQILCNARLDILTETRSFPYPDFVELIVRSIHQVFERGRESIMSSLDDDVGDQGT